MILLSIYLEKYTVDCKGHPRDLPVGNKSEKKKSDNFLRPGVDNSFIVHTEVFHTTVQYQILLQLVV